MTESKPVTTVLSLGAGVQSSTLLLMSMRGILSRIDHAEGVWAEWMPYQAQKHAEAAAKAG